MELLKAVLILAGIEAVLAVVLFAVIIHMGWVPRISAYLERKLFSEDNGNEDF